MKVQATVLFLAIFSTIVLFALRNYDPGYNNSFGNRLQFWLFFLLIVAAWIFVLYLVSKPASAPMPSKKETELEEKLQYLSKIYQALSNSLRIEKQKVESIISLAPDGIFTFDKSGIVASWNRSMEILTEISGENAIGKSYHDSVALLSANGQELFDPFSPCFSDGKSVSLLDCRMESASGKNLPVALGAAPVRQEKKGTEQVIVTVKDISAQKEAEKFKEEMMAMITHDLRSPLTAMMGYVSLCQNPKLCREEADRQKYLESIVRCGKGMLLLINNLLGTAKVEEGKLSVKKEPVTVKSILEEVAESLDVLAKGKNLLLTVEALDTIRALTDRERLQEILVNLVTNAIKFSRAGERVELAAFEDRDEVRIAVRDSGPGIAPEEKAGLFEKFSRVRKRGSLTGLGLYIARTLVRALEGRIEVESEQGRGSVFTVSLPVYREAPEPLEQLSLLAIKRGVVE